MICIKVVNLIEMLDNPQTFLNVVDKMTVRSLVLYGVLYVYTLLSLLRVNLLCDKDIEISHKLTCVVVRTKLMHSLLLKLSICSKYLLNCTFYSVIVPRHGEAIGGGGGIEILGVRGCVRASGRPWVRHKAC